MGQTQGFNYMVMLSAMILAMEECQAVIQEGFTFSLIITIQKVNHNMNIWGYAKLRLIYTN